jgi:hypothetical protein
VPGALLSLDFPMAVGRQKYPRLHGEPYTKMSEATVPTRSYNISLAKGYIIGSKREKIVLLYNIDGNNTLSYSEK